MKRQQPIEIEVKKHGENWAVYAEKKLVAVAVYRKGAVTLEALLRLLIRYASRKPFQTGVGTFTNTGWESSPASPEGADVTARFTTG